MDTADRRDGIGPDTIGPDKIRPDTIGPDRIGPDPIGPDPIRPGNPRPGGPSVALEQAFDGDTLYALRSAVAAHASDLGATEQGVLDVTLVAHELAANAIQHAGGRGRLRLWRDRDHLCCEVSDRGGGLSIPDPGHHLVEPLSPGGRGLWLIRQLSQRVRIVSGGDGTTVTAAVAVEPPPRDL
jgi:anti-sigma regulatory factor (Ser/Thr protein kinase)